MFGTPHFAFNELARLGEVHSNAAERAAKTYVCRLNSILQWTTAESPGDMITQ